MRFSSNSVPTVAPVQAESKQEEKTEETKDEPKVTESPGWVPVDGAGKDTEAKPDEKETVDKEKEDNKAEEKASSSEAEVKPAESSLPAPVTSEPEVVKVVHTGIVCDGCKVRLSIKIGILSARVLTAMNLDCTGRYHWHALEVCRLSGLRSLRQML